MAQEQNELSSHQPVCLESVLKHKEHFLQNLLILGVETNKETVSPVTVDDQVELPLYRGPQKILLLIAVVVTQQSEQE